ncbi:MAG: PhzF family phenazine biosynthesis protein, partial [Burkholderiales bacterium]
LAYAWARIDDTTVRARFFFTKYSSVIEDPGTGSACANLGGWFVAQGAKLPLRVKVLQGDQVGRPCRLGLRVEADKQIYVSGRVIALGGGEIDL